MNVKPAPLRVGYIVKMFPRLSETFILNEILELERQGVDVVIFSLKKPNEGQFHPQLAHLRARVWYLDDFDLKKWPVWIAPEWPFLEAHQSGLFKLLAEGLAAGDALRIDQVWQAAWVAARAHSFGIVHLHAHFASLPSTLAYFAHRISGIPFTYTAHAKDIYVYTANEHHLEDKLRHAACTITVTQFNRRYLEATYPGASDGRLRVLHNGIDLDLFKRDPNVRRESALIVSVGRLVPKKGFDVLLAALARLKQSGVPFTCRIVGDGGEAQTLTELRDRLGLSSEVEFSGACNRDEVVKLMQRATLLCLPCVVAEDGNVDALPTVLLEALGCGLPVVSTSVSGIPEIIEHEQTGLLSPPNDPTALADQMQKLMRSEELRSRFATAGRLRAEERFDLHRNVAELLSVFQNSQNADRDSRRDSSAMLAGAGHVA